MIFSAEHVLKDLNKHVKKRIPFSNIRLGDACNIILGMALTTDMFRGNFIDIRGKSRPYSKWRNSIIKIRHSFSNRELREIALQIVKYCNKANYIDSLTEYKNYKWKPNLPIEIFSRWEEVHEKVGINNNTKYTSMFLNHLSVIGGEYNILNVMKDRKVYFINNDADKVSKKFRNRCEKVGFYKIHVRPRSHYRTQYKFIMKALPTLVPKYDLFIIGAGLLGKIYSGYIKELGGVSYDMGRVFRLWNGEGFIPAPFEKEYEASKKFTLYHRRSEK